MKGASSDVFSVQRAKWISYRKLRKGAVGIQEALLGNCRRIIDILKKHERRGTILRKNFFQRIILKKGDGIYSHIVTG